MTFDWNPEAIRFMEDALRRSSYFEKLSETIVPYLAGAREVCDAGCGLGQLSEALGRRGFRMTAADLSHNAIEYLKGKDYTNVFPLECNLLTMDRQQAFDAMVFHYFGSMEDILRIGRNLSKGPLVVVKRNYNTHRFSIGENRIQSHTAMTAEDYLQSQGISYEKMTLEEEMGQPFRTREDALRFFTLYSRDEDRSLITLENIVPRLEETGDKEFPFYLKKRKSSMILVLREYGQTEFS